MRLYHSTIQEKFYILVMLIFLSACASPAATQELITVNLSIDGSTQEVKLPVGSTVQRALEQEGITLDYLDRVEPAPFTILSNGMSIRVIRVREEFEVEEETIPFERQMLQTESLAEADTLLMQSGVNGKQEITYRIVYEDGVEISKYPVRSTIIQEAQPEIYMVGIRTPFIPVAIPGRIAYLLGSNAWIMEQSTGNRQPVVTTNDLDGRVFRLSRDRSRLLFTRRSTDENQINSLWVANLETDPIELYDLQVANVIHFADFVPNGKNDQVAFSTVEPRQTAPGWQANNDFNILNYSSSGWVSRWKVYVDANSGGVYGWWGTNYAYDNTGEQVAFTRPDSVGLVDLENGSLATLAEIIPLQTGGDWAWVPGISWSPDSQAIFFVDHSSPQGVAQPEESQDFDLATVLINTGSNLHIVPQTGMFAYPVASPMQTTPNGDSGYQIAYLQAITPSQSESSRYRLAVMDRDGSNRRILFPAEGAPGLEPQQGIWSPEILPDFGLYAIIVVYQGNLWLIDPSGVQTPRQITGDGLVSRIDWK
jgi:hypothetical protein